GFAGMDKDKGKDTIKAMDDAMNKHGLTEEYLKTVEKDNPGKKGTPQEERDMLRKLVAPVKDKSAFIADIMTALKKSGDKDSFSIGTDLKDVKIDGDKATGTV